MASKRGSGEGKARLYMHDVRLNNGAIVSTACEGETCVVCAGDPAAAKRSGNPYFPWPTEEEPLDLPPLDAVADDHVTVISDDTGSITILPSTLYSELVGSLRAAEIALAEATKIITENCPELTRIDLARHLSIARDALAKVETTTEHRK